MRFGGGVRCRALLDERRHAADLKGTFDLIERVAVIARQLAGLREGVSDQPCNGRIVVDGVHSV